ncbi:hypothetical protein [Nostoc sp. CCY 9925]
MLLPAKRSHLKQFIYPHLRLKPEIKLIAHQWQAIALSHEQGT